MATLTFPSVRFSSADIKKLLTDNSTKNFARLCIQFYMQSDTTLTLVAQVVGAGRHKMDVPLIFSTPHGTDSVQINGDMLFGQYELSRGQIMQLTDQGSKDLDLTPSKMKINPDSISYDANGTTTNPCPPADPPPGS
jgi:hypothetical protein